MKIVVISDTHGLLRSEVVELIEKCDAVIHCGDVDTKKLFNELKAVAKDKPLFIVRGNNDKALVDVLPESLEFILDGIKFYIVHNKTDIPKNVDADVIIFGHSHKYYEEIIGERLRLNPGSCGRRRFNLPITMALLTVEDGACTVNKIEIETEKKVSSDISLGNIKAIMRYMDKGEDVQKISGKLSLDCEFVEQIARIRVTHPGVTAEGILNKIEVNKIYE